MTKQFIISAPNSNAGKTTITLGLLRLFKRKNIAIQPFKVGPDYIDPKFHELACGKVGVNLDLFMMSQQEINNNLSYYGNKADINCIEGVMGLFDGAIKDSGSTAELAKKLKTPILLVVDAKAVAYSVAPLIQGFINFDKDAKIIGVIFNRVGSEKHYSMLKEACEDINVNCFGYLANLKNIEIPSRHLGLNIKQIEAFDFIIDQIANELEKTVNWDAILEVSKIVDSRLTFIPKTGATKNIKFAIAKDEAFNFIYPHNVNAMKQLGEVIFFSPIHDAVVPKCDFIFLPGGYPESYLNELSSNSSMLQSIKNFADNNGQIYAECGGMMYLGKAIISEENKPYKMVGFFNYESTIATKKLHLGYRISKTNNHIFKGHEFHYSSLQNDNETILNATVLNARNVEIDTKIHKKNNVIGSYIHYYFGTTEILLQLINQLNNDT